MISFFTGELNVIDTIFGAILQMVTIVCIFALLNEFAKWLTDFNATMRIYREQKKLLKEYEEKTKDKDNDKQRRTN